jgi:L-fuconolactonase
MLDAHAPPGMLDAHAPPGMLDAHPSPGMLDAHVHLWDLTVRDQPWIPPGSPIRRAFALPDLQTALVDTPVTGVILVQALNTPAETADLLAHACPTASLDPARQADPDRQADPARHADQARQADPARQAGLVRGVVGWADLAAPDFAAGLDRLQSTGWLVGLRHQALAEPDPAAWLARPEVARGLTVLEAAGLPFDLMIRPAHFAAARQVARDHPGLQFVLDHLGKPPIAAGGLGPWAAALRALAAEPNVACKLSGLQTIASADWTYRDLAPYIDVALEAFGPSRLLFGSDWPVSSQAASYSTVCDVARTACSALSRDEQTAVLAANARAIYRPR